MKTHTIKTPTAELLIVQLPPRATDFSNVNNDEATLICAFNEYEGCLTAKEIPKDYTLLGKPDEIREEDAKELVENKGNYYKNYSPIQGSVQGNITFTATESLLSAIESEIYWENPHQDMKGSVLDMTLGQWRYKKKFLEAQEKTFDRNRSIILVKN